MKVSVLVEDTTRNDLACEHGLSFLIEYKDHTILLDSGTTSMFMENAKKMNVSLENIEICALSHGHYDHADGFVSFLKKYPDKKVVAMKNYDLNYMSGSNDHIHYVGVHDTLKTMYKNNFITVEDVYEILSEVTFIPHFSSLEKIGEKSKLYVEKSHELYGDDFSHEASLVFESEKGLIVFNSCSHGGVQTIIEDVRKVFPLKPIYAYVGGLHMKTKSKGIEGCAFSKEEIENLVSLLKQEGCKYLYTGHCTGSIAMKILKEIDADFVHSLYSGQTFEL